MWLLQGVDITNYHNVQQGTDKSRAQQDQCGKYLMITILTAFFADFAEIVYISIFINLLKILNECTKSTIYVKLQI